MRYTKADLEAIRDVYLRTTGRLGSDYASRMVRTVLDEIEPRLVFTEEAAGAEWLMHRVLLESLLGANARDPAREHFDRLIEALGRFLPVDGGRAPRRSFRFIQAADLRRVAEDDWTRAVAAAQREEAKTTAIAAGSVVEAIALDVLERIGEPDRARLRAHVNGLAQPQRRNLREAPAELARWSAAYRLFAIGPGGLAILSERTHEIGHQLRDWRNDVHPDLARANPAFSAADGRLAVGFAEKVIEEVELWHDTGAVVRIP